MRFASAFPLLLCLFSAPALAAGDTIPRALMHDFLVAEIAAQRGDLSPPALYSQARLTLHDPQASKAETAEAASKLASAAEAGYAPAQVLYGSVLATGSLGIPQDIPRALAYFESAASEGFPAAQFMLGLILTDASLGSRDEPRGDELLLQAWLGGVEDAREALLGRYVSGSSSAAETLQKAQAAGLIRLGPLSGSEPPAP